LIGDMGQIKYYNLMIIPDGVDKPHGIKVKAWLFKAIIIAAIALAILLLVVFLSYGKLLAQAGMAERLQKENEMLRLYKYKLGLLEANMKEIQTVVDRIAQLAGVDFKMPELPPDSILMANIDAGATEVKLPADNRRDIPDGVPLKGFMTRGYSDDSVENHPGIDIACTIGTPVLATAAGKVSFAGFDSTYGLSIIIDHAMGVSTLYGHVSEILVRAGDDVAAGSKIALSGNTGKSSAPHLHYEIRENGIAVNPLKYIGENEISSKQN
jgi:murein DD-endopeptidase MepM/ murein hydrolase activator NlpD